MYTKSLYSFNDTTLLKKYKAILSQHSFFTITDHSSFKFKTLTTRVPYLPQY